MPRSVTVSLPADRAVHLVEELSVFDGTISLSRQPNASVLPPGDLVTVEVLDRSVSALFAVLARHGAGSDDGVSVATSEPTALVSHSASAGLASDPSTASFEEAEAILEREGTIGPSKAVAMAVAGSVAAVGILTNSPHLVIGAMVIAPGFEPFSKVALRITGPTRSFRRGFFDMAVGWSALVVGAGAAALVMRFSGVSMGSPTGGYLAPGSLVGYWRELTAAATLVAVVGGAAGAVLIIANRAVLTAGVMIALALVPSAALVGIALVEADVELVSDGALRWAHDGAIVTAAGAVVFALYRARRGRALGRA